MSITKPSIWDAAQLQKPKKEDMEVTDVKARWWLPRA